MKACSARECQVAAFDHNVIPLHAHSTASPKARASSPAITLSWLRVAANQLDELSSCAERVALDPQWSAMEWRATCAPLLIRLTGARQLLTSLSSIRLGQWPDTEWAARVRTSRSDVERRLLDVRVAMSRVTSDGTSDPDAVVALASDALLLASAVGKLRTLIITHYPAAAGPGT